MFISLTRSRNARQDSNLRRRGVDKAYLASGWLRLAREPVLVYADLKFWQPETARDSWESRVPSLQQHEMSARRNVNAHTKDCSRVR
jgi:hypothetical protein